MSAGTSTRPAAPSGVRRLTAGTGTHYADHLASLGDLPCLDLARLVALTDAAGLTGRGGAGFPTTRKIAAVAGAGRSPVVVANAMEGEFLSHKDRYLLNHAPHLVLDGLDVLAGALGARRRILAVGERTHPGPARVAAANRPVHAGIAGRSARPVEVHALGGGFVGGQESALVNQLNGHAAVPTDPHTPVWRKGVDGRPTLVANAETLAHLALLVRFGADWFTSVGTATDPGTFLATVSGSSDGVLPESAVLEVARGTRVRDVLGAAGVDLGRTRAVLVGGYHGAWLGADELDAPMSREGLSPHGATVGAGIVLALDDRACPLRSSAQMVSYLAGEVAGQCGPCINGLPRMAETLQRLAVPGADALLVAEVDRLRALVVGRGACAHPDGTARLVASTMRTFAAHVESHLSGECPR